MKKSKPDAQRIKTFLESLKEESWIKNTERDVWPNFVFHYTTLLNVKKILQDGCLFCRNSLEKMGQIPEDVGSPLVLDGTIEDVKENVRLYFRPKTPTQFHNEGIRTKSQITSLKAHNPIPIFFLFNSFEVLSMSNCKFSEGNLAKSSALPKYYSTAEELENLPWKKIYHTGHFDPNTDSIITFHRNAEVIVSKALPLNSLRYIYCRSQAEKETLVQLLPKNMQKKYLRVILSTTRRSLFFKQHTFIETVDMDKGSCLIHFSPDTKSPGPFFLKVEVSKNGQLVFEVRREDFVIRNTTAITKLNFSYPLPQYTLKISLDGHLMYCNSFHQSDVSF